MFKIIIILSEQGMKNKKYDIINNLKLSETYYIYIHTYIFI